MNWERSVSSFLNKKLKRRDLLESSIIGGSAIAVLALTRNNQKPKKIEKPIDTIDTQESSAPVTAAPIEVGIDPVTFLQEFDKILDELKTNPALFTSQSQGISLEIFHLVSDRDNPISVTRYLYDNKPSGNSSQYRSISLENTHYEKMDDDQIYVNYIIKKEVTTYTFMDNKAPEKLTITYSGNRNNFRMLENYKGPEPVSQVELGHVLNLLKSAKTDNQRMPLDLGSSNEPKRL